MIGLPEEDVKKFRIERSNGFSRWINESKISIAFSTYQVGKMFMVGSKDQESLSVVERSFDRCMGLAKTDNGFWMSSVDQLWRFENSLSPGQVHQGYDKMYIPQQTYFTGDIDVHDIISIQGRPIFINTVFSCVATVSSTHSFKPLWKPKFITKLAPEDRCHLNGLAEKDGKPAYVTAVGVSDSANGWRAHKSNGGVVIDISTSEIVSEGLSMPHSPRWHHGKLWVLNSGTGYLGYIDELSGKFIQTTFCPGFLRGMDFYGKYAIVGISKGRKNSTFGGLDLDKNLINYGLDPKCGILVIDTETGEIVHSMFVEGMIDELFDVKVLNDVSRPMIIGTKSDEIKKMISIEN